MDKESALIEFLTSFRAAVNNSLAYSRGHPYFSKTSQELKEKIESLFNFLNPIIIKVSPNALFLDGRYWEKIVSSQELSKTLHQRKVKSIEFRPGLSNSEVEEFLSLLSLQPKELFKKGSLSSLLKNSGCLNILVEDLDYSALLGSQGEDAANVWLYLFKDAVAKGDGRKISEFAENFSKGVNNLSVKAVIEDEELRRSLRGFFKYVKANKQEDSSRCFQELSAGLLNTARPIGIDDVKKLKEIFKDFNGEDFSDLLVSQVSNEKGLDPLSLGLFSQLAGDEKADEITSSFIKKAQGNPDLKNNPRLVNKIKDLLSSSAVEGISPVYRNALASLVKDISFSDTLVFDRQLLEVNYRFIILNMLSQEKGREGLGLLLARLDKEWEVIIQDKDYGFLKLLLDIAKSKSNDWQLPGGVFEGIEKRIVDFAESVIWDEAPSESLADLVKALEKSYTTADFYLNKIFRENKPTAYGLELFLRFFPANLDVFYASLRERHSDPKFLSGFIAALSQNKLPVSLAVLKEIFYFGSDSVKIEALSAMQDNPGCDVEFILSVLREGKYTLRKAALSALLKNGVAREKAAELLLGIPSPWGFRNNTLIENMMIAEELGLKEASSYLVNFSKRRFFWNWQLREKALRVLEGWK